MESDDNKNTRKMLINEDIQNNYNQEKYDNRSKIRKRAINKILMKKTVVFVEEITNEKLDEIGKLDYNNQFEIINSYLISNNEPNILKILAYIIKKICPLPAENKTKIKMLNQNILQNVLNIFFSTNNSDIFSQCSSILSTFCTDYILFSMIMINEETIKKIYNDLQTKYFSNPYIIANCINCFKEGLNHLNDLKNTTDINDRINQNIKDISYNSKRLLCNFANWILNNKELYFSIPQEGMQSFFKLLELLIITVSVPNNYEMDFYLNYSGTSHFENLILYIFGLPLKDFDYDTLDFYLCLLISISNNEKYFAPITQYYNKVSIFDIIKKLCGYMYLNSNSTVEDRNNFPPLEPDLIIYCLQILTNLIQETINHNDIILLFFKFFQNYRGTVRSDKKVPTAIMKFLLKLSEKINCSEKIYNFIFYSENNIINDCIKFYSRNNECYVLVLEFLVNIFEVKNPNEIENVGFNKILKCFRDALEIKDKSVINTSVNCLAKIIEISNRKNYNIDLLLKFEENHIIEKLNLLILNKLLNNSEEKIAEEIIKYIENRIKEEEK